MSQISSSPAPLLHEQWRRAARATEKGGSLPWSCRQVTRWLTRFGLFLLLVGSFLSQTGTPPAHAAPLTNSFDPLPGNEASSLSFQGGWIQQHPVVYLDFWGPKWNSDQTHKDTRNQVIATFGMLAGSQYNNILTQYRNPEDTANPDNFVHNDVRLGGYMTDSATPPSDMFIGIENIMGGGAIKDEAVNVFTTLHLSQNKYLQILIFPQQGSTFNLLNDGACGAHSYDPDHTLPYGFVRWSQDVECNLTGNVPQNIAWTAVHEYAETATDPHIYKVGGPVLPALMPINGSGWNTGESSWTPQEVADLCENYSPTNGLVWDSSLNSGQGDYYKDRFGKHVAWPSYTSVTGNTFTLPFLWSNNDKGCVMSQGQEYPSPDSTAPFHGIHTVEQPILQIYQADISFLGEPTSEQIPIQILGTNGWVSYFQGTRCTANNQGSAIYWAPGQIMSPHEVHDCIYQRYQATCQQVNNPCIYLLGFPVTDEMSIAGGHVSYFAGQVCSTGGGPSNSGSAIYYGGRAGAKEVHGCIYHKYITAGGPGGRLGFPVSDEYTNSAGYRESDFQGGNIQFINGVASVQYSPICTSPVAVYGLANNFSDLKWYGYTNPTGGSRSWATGSGNTVGTNWWPAFSGGNGIIYSIHGDGTLWWYKHLGASNGTFSWQGGKQIGNGWHFSYVFSGGNGVIYAVDSAGNLHWYRHLGYADGSSSWASGEGTIVGTGWGLSSTGIATVFSGGGGIIYALHTDGTLHWYNHLGSLNGSKSWASGSGQTVFSGWPGGSGPISIFSAGGGIIFEVQANGDLYWYDHLGFQSGSSIWANGGQGKLIGNGWTFLYSPFANVNGCH